jgi:hypothetical protein
VVLYEKATTGLIYCTRQVHGAADPRKTFEAGMRDATHQALVVLCHEEDVPMEHTKYRHFLSRPYEGTDTVVLLPNIAIPWGVYMINYDSLVI